MNSKYNWILCLFGFLLLANLTGCGAPAATPTPEPSPESVVEVGEVIFDGEACKFTGPTELSPGKYSFVLKDLSELNAGIGVYRLANGKTFQDLFDFQGEPWDCLAKLDWVFLGVEPRSAWHKPDGGEVHTYSFTIEAEYAIVLWSFHPSNIWVCAPFWVVEAPSD
jgi:hypothetical protein